MTQTAPPEISGDQTPRIPNDKTFGARLALVRQMMGWGNVAEAAKECGLPVDSWRHWERDNMEPRRLVTIALAIATRANVDLDWLVYGPVKPSPAARIASDMLRDPLAARVIRTIGHGDARRRQPNGRYAGRTQTPQHTPHSQSSAPRSRVSVA